MPTATSEVAGLKPEISTPPTIPAENPLVPQNEETDSTPKPDTELSPLPQDALNNNSDSNNTTETTLPAETSIKNIPTLGCEIEPKIEEPMIPLLDRALTALSGASETTLIAGLSVVALMISFMLGKVGLLLVGTVLGAMFHAALQSQNRYPDAVKSLVQPKESVATVDTEETKDKTTPDDAIADFSSLHPKVASALDELCNSIVKDCINSWYMPLIPDDSSFSATCHQHLTQAFVRFARHMNSKRPADVFLMSVFNVSSTMMMFMRELSQALNGTRDIKSGVRAYLSANPDSILATMLQKGEQDRKLKALATDIVEQFAPRDLKNCEPISLFLRHILRSVILWNMVEKFSDPEFINEWIIYLLEQKENTGPSTEGVGAVLQAFDRSVAGAAQGNLPKVSTSVTPETRSATQSPTTRKENIRPSPATNVVNGNAITNGTYAVNGVNSANSFSTGSPQKTTKPQPFENNRNGDTMKAGRESLDGWSRKPNTQREFDSRRSLDVISTSQNQSPVESTPQSPADTSMKRTSSNASSRASTSELSTTSHKTSSESSRSGIDPPQTAEQPPKPINPSLHNARVTVVDSGPTSNPPRMLRWKPKNLFMIQLEPLDSAGRIVMRNYQEFETLHETLLSVARVTGSDKYNMAYSDGLPTWRDRYIDEVVSLLELYLRIALSEEHLAKTDAMYKFFEKDEDKRERQIKEKVENVPPWRTSTSFESVGKNVLGAITKAPQSASEGGKAFFGGIKKALTPSPAQSPNERDTIRLPFGFISGNGSRTASRVRLNEMDDSDASEQTPTPTNAGQIKEDVKTETATDSPSENRGRFSLLRRQTAIPANPPLPPRRAASVVGARTSNLQIINGADEDLSQSTPSLLERESTDEAGELTMTFESSDLDGLSLPPPPSEIDNFDSFSETDAPVYKPHIPPAVWYEGITEQETQYVIESMFSIINELYSLSTAWMIRRSFLNIAKSVMLRPGNSQLIGMRNMIQSDVLQANTKPEVIADYIRQIRKNSLPTAAESEEWEKTRKPRTDEEKEELRRKARVLLSESLPQGLTAVLGVNQTKEAMYQLFDALQEREIARGLWTAIITGTMPIICQ
ncbi:hypothetical protein ABW20_dc0101342 [Dactylellina cionopaga]|nr:hypothetical protein ABW20_dc0101342 [Dactylellina cionopaga]